jgi:hypothetical protein
MPKVPNSHPPRRSPTEYYLQRRAVRMLEPPPPLLVRLLSLPETTIQFSPEFALSLVTRRVATVVADLLAVPSLILTDEDLAETGLDLLSLEVAA